MYRLELCAGAAGEFVVLRLCLTFKCLGNCKIVDGLLVEYIGWVCRAMYCWEGKMV